MARAEKNALHRSRIDLDRQQRHEQPEVPGATGKLDQVPPNPPK
jgi:hypothetical protein